MIGCVPKSWKKRLKLSMTIEDAEKKRCRSAEVKAARFNILKCRASVDRCETKIKETASTLNYITPHFRAESVVEINGLKEGEIYTVGWVQAVTNMAFYNSYPSGQSSWEIQELNRGETTAVSDADGRQYPWYGVTTECVTVHGPCKVGRVRVYMNDNFSPTVSWAIPVGRDQPDTLQRVSRDQSFAAWLVVKDEITGETWALKAFKWRAVVNIAVDCSRCIGQRAKLISPYLQSQPEETSDLLLPKSALYSPRANEAQKFVWRTLESELVFEVSCVQSPVAAGSPAMSDTPSSPQSVVAGNEERCPSCRYTPY